MAERFGRMSRLDICNSFVSLLLYLAQISWLVYGNYLYFNLPLDVPGVYDDPSKATIEQSDPAEINSEKWLYIALMTVLTIGYVHLMIFIALIVIFIVYSIGQCCLNEEEAQEQVGHLSPVKLWLFIDEGIFSLLDDIDDIDVSEDDERRN